MILMMLPLSSFGQSFEERKLSFVIGIPEGNHILHKTQDFEIEKSGFMLFTGGMKVRISEKNSVLISAGWVMNFPVFAPAPYDCQELCEGLNNQFASARLEGKFLKNKLIYGAGLQVTSSNYNYSYFPFDSVSSADNPADSNYSSISNSLGIHLSLHYAFTKVFSVGVNYLPSFLSLDNMRFMYSHTLFLELRFDIRTRRRRMKD